MTFDPLNEIVTDMQRKMKKIYSPAPAVCIANNQAELLYMDEMLGERLEYIIEYIKKNFDLIEEGQYSFPISGTLLGFFKMTSQIMFILYGKSGKIGNLLLFRGLLENFGQLIDELSSDLESMKRVEKNANLVIKLSKTQELVGPDFIENLHAPPEEVVASERIEIGGPIPTPSPAIAPFPEGPVELYPELLERFRNKKFNFQEGIIMQYADGQLSLSEIVTKSKYTKEEVLEIINSYQKKGWLKIHKKRAGKVLDKLIDVISSTQKEISSEAQQKADEMLSLRVPPPKYLQKCIQNS
ncbi:MAG: hypothetical protein HWN66_02160 [Candidatus Helarchaeota archaeon]|nr:hypothetical protein [Candidatus Helarchaeota archaeon]